MKQTIAALALLLAGYIAGTALPRASADSGLGEITRHLSGVHSELQAIRRSLEKMASKP
jgi:hypothetical protein